MARSTDLIKLDLSGFKADLDGLKDIYNEAV